ncbi:MAG TPA: DNA polymerase III subunit [Candidatus Binataceae bacterium]|nr:DNA polymerase III subunit [Candidatus Binataceae bacterium]
MPLTDLAGHQELFQRLNQELDRRPAHAYLFWGPRGIGKAMVAEALALSRLCERNQTGDFCCQLLSCPSRDLPAAPRRGRAAVAQCQCCTGCVQVARRVHPDFDYLARAENRSFVLIEQVRELIAHLGGKAVRGRGRIAIIDDAQALNLAAQNALLKTLEEPPGQSLLILVSESQSALLDTVRSRLRPVRFAPLPVKALSALLERKAGLEPTRAAALARLARGSAARALELVKTTPPVGELVAALRDLPHLDFVAIRALAERFFGNREEAIDNFELLARLLEELLARQLLEAGSGTFVDLDSALAELARTLSRDQILIILDLALTAATAVGAMANSRLQAEGLWLAASDALRQGAT